MVLGSEDVATAHKCKGRLARGRTLKTPQIPQPVSGTGLGRFHCKLSFTAPRQATSGSLWMHRAPRAPARDSALNPGSQQMGATLSTQCLARVLTREKPRDRTPMFLPRSPCSSLAVPQPWLLPDLTSQVRRLRAFSSLRSSTSSKHPSLGVSAQPRGCRGAMRRALGHGSC